MLWYLVSQTLPPDGLVVDTMSPGGLQQRLKRSGNLWFTSDGAMYVYYTPSHWRHI